MQLSSLQRAQIDEFGELQRRVAEFQPTAKRSKELAEQIESWCTDEPAGLSLVLEGERYTAQISAQKLESEVVDLPKLLKKIGPNRFLLLVKGLVTKARSVLTPEEAKIFVAEERTGSRTVKAVAKHQAEVIEMPTTSRKRRTA